MGSKPVCVAANRAYQTRACIMNWYAPVTHTWYHAVLRPAQMCPEVLWALYMFTQQITMNIIAESTVNW